MTHRTYEPAWLTEATFELNELMREVSGVTLPDPLGIYKPVANDNDTEDADDD